MKMTVLESRITKLETYSRPIDEALLVDCAIRREHYLSHGLTPPEHVMDSELNRLRMLDSLPVGTSPLIETAWEIARNPSGPVYESTEIQ
ncbi:MAG TPA: hypothetical protein VMW15_08910 [Terracidiphilus sp.]|nr:hypothetical protein [Terracidiphilus sp.]